MHPLMRRAFAATAVLFLLSSAVPALAQVGACADRDALTDSNKTIADNIARESGHPFSSFSCQNVSGVESGPRGQRCVSGLCAGGDDIVCCAPETGGRPGTAGTGDAAGSAGSGGGFLRLELPACTKDGDCSLDDIVQTGVNFANFLFGLSGAILLATFVYGGVLYLTAGSSGNVSKAKDMLKNALIGMVLVFGAGLLVSTIYDTFRSDTAGGGDTCTVRKPGFSCQYLRAAGTDAAAIQAEMDSRGCVADLCAGDETRRCCPESATP